LRCDRIGIKIADTFTVPAGVARKRPTPKTDGPELIEQAES